MTIPFQNLVPFIGMVQAGNDPTKAGRCKVRCFGFHPPNSNRDVDNDHLPWAVMLNNSMGAVQSPDAKPGEMVFGFFLDGRDAQFPVIIGSIPSFGQGLMQNAWSDNSPGTAAAAVAAPTAPHHTGLDVEATAAAAAMGAAGAVTDATGNHDVFFPAPSLGGSGGSSLNSPQYGGSHVYAGDHVTLFHRSGSVIQVSPSGDVVIQSLSDSYYTSMGDSAERVSGTKNIMSRVFNVSVGENCNLTVQGNMTHTVMGDYNIRVGGKFNVLAGEQVELQGAKAGLHGYSESVNITAATDLLTSAEGNINIFSGADLGISVGGSADILGSGDLRIGSDGGLHLSGQNINAEGSSGVDILGGGAVNIDGSTVNLNSGGAAGADSAVPDMANTPSRTDLGDVPESSAVPADDVTRESFDDTAVGGADGDAVAEPDGDLGDSAADVEADDAAPVEAPVEAVTADPGVYDEITNQRLDTVGASDTERARMLQLMEENPGFSVPVRDPNTGELYLTTPDVHRLPNGEIFRGTRQEALDFANDNGYVLPTIALEDALIAQAASDPNAVTVPFLPQSDSQGYASGDFRLVDQHTAALESQYQQYGVVPGQTIVVGQNKPIVLVNGVPTSYGGETGINQGTGQHYPGWGDYSEIPRYYIRVE